MTFGVVWRGHPIRKCESVLVKAFLPVAPLAGVAGTASSALAPFGVQGDLSCLEVGTDMSSMLKMVEMVGLLCIRWRGLVTPSDRRLLEGER